MATQNNNNISIEQQLATLKSAVDTLTKQRDKAEWEMNRIRAELKEKFGLDSVQATKEEAGRLQKEAAELEKHLHESITNIHKLFGALLELANIGAK